MAAVAPAAPTLSAVAGYRQVMLTWTQGGDAPVNSYRIEKLNDQSNWDTETTRPASSAHSYTDTGLADSTVHTYRIIDHQRCRRERTVEFGRRHHPGATGADAWPADRLDSSHRPPAR